MLAAAAVAVGLQVAHESWFEVGAVLTGFEAGGVWVRETGR